MRNELSENNFSSEQPPTSMAGAIVVICSHDFKGTTVQDRQLFGSRIRIHKT